MSKYIDIRVTTLSDEDLKDFIIALRKIQWCGESGANRELPLQIDGDGSGSFNFELFESGQRVKRTNLRDIVNLDEKELKKVSDGNDFETHYIGE
jgi:hypothetical protein